MGGGGGIGCPSGPPPPTKLSSGRKNLSKGPTIGDRLAVHRRALASDPPPPPRVTVGLVVAPPISATRGSGNAMKLPAIRRKKEKIDHRRPQNCFFGAGGALAHRLGTAPPQPLYKWKTDPPMQSDEAADVGRAKRPAHPHGEWVAGNTGPHRGWGRLATGEGEGGGGARAPSPPPCDIPSGCCSFTGPWTVTRSSLRMLRRVAAFCRPLRPVLLPVSVLRSRSPVVVRGAPPPPPGGGGWGSPGMPCPGRPVARERPGTRTTKKKKENGTCAIRTQTGP